VKVDFDLGNPTAETDSVAEGAVGREPVSTSNSLLIPAFKDPDS
jgi:hypothetical protein